MDFEKAMNRLEKIINHLESGDLQLEKSLKLYEEGMHLSKRCQERLSNVERKVYILKNGENHFREEESNSDKKLSLKETNLSDNFDLFEEI